MMAFFCCRVKCFLQALHFQVQMCEPRLQRYKSLLQSLPMQHSCLRPVSRKKNIPKSLPSHTSRQVVLILAMLNVCLNNGSRASWLSDSKHSGAVSIYDLNELVYTCVLQAMPPDTWINSSIYVIIHRVIIDGCRR